MSVQYIRVERAATGSWLTLKLPHPMTHSDACDWAERLLPGWEAGISCDTDPDK